MPDDDNKIELLTFARRCAVSFCRRNHCPDLVDDATGEASVYLVTHYNDFLTLDRPLLAYRTYCALLNAFRKEFRRRDRFKNDGDNLANRADKTNDVESFDNREEARYLITRAAINAGAVDCLPLFFAIADGLSTEEAAAAFNVPTRTASRYFFRFLFELRKLDTERGVFIVEPRDFDGKTPLFKKQ